MTGPSLRNPRQAARPIAVAAVLLTALAAYLLYPPAPASAHHLCPNTGSPFGPFSIDTYEAADYRNLYARTFELAAFNDLFPEHAGFTLPNVETGARAAGSGQTAEGYIPPVILKSIGFLESGWAQASYSPLVQYGEVGPVLSSHDCGYGIMQITTGMQNISGVPNMDQAMIGTHYAFNIARGAKILAEKWNMSPEYRPVVGSRNPLLIEDWYYALWGYNGFAYSNHPLNPAYQVTRVQFSCGSEGDGYGHDRTQYPYQELLLGCVQRPPTRAAQQLWPPQEVHLPELNNATFATPLKIENWNPCAYSLDCAAMDFPTPNAFHTDATTPQGARADIIGSPVMALSAGGEGVNVQPGAGASNLSFSVNNSGTGVLGYQALSDTSWLSVAQFAGVALGDELGGHDGTVQLTLNPAGLPAGAHTAKVTVSSLYAAGAPKTFTVTLAVGPTPTPAPTPANTGKWGDVDCSQAAPDPVDSLLTLRHDAGLSADTAGCPAVGTAFVMVDTFIWGDVDCSGDVNPVDSLKILRFDSGLGIGQVPGCPALGSTIIFPG